MSSNEILEASPLKLWLDRWLAPPWRALLTWLALSALSGWMYDRGVWHGVSTVLAATDRVVSTILDTIDLPPMPPFVHRAAFITNMLVIWFWFEPIILRLNLFRGLSWLVLRCVPSLVLGLGAASYTLNGPSQFLASSVLTAPLLFRWRTRPWMTVIGGVLMTGMVYATSWLFDLFQLTAGNDWWRGPLMNLPFAAILLYGTRLLRPEERTRVLAEKADFR